MLASQAYAAVGAPEALKGKSVVLTWSETRQQRHVGEPNFYTVNASVNLVVYVSMADRIFVRQINSTRSGSGSFERSPDAHSGGAASFAGHTLTLIGGTAGGAHRTLVDFDPSFTSCSARVSLGFQSGKTSISFSPITKRQVEMKSMTASGISCSIRAGNVLSGAS
jgi:hypothetical protein